MHEAAEKFDPRTEQVFKVLQVISACAMSFAHGANDVANSIGSFCAAFYVYQNQAVPGSNAEVRVVWRVLARRMGWAGCGGIRLAPRRASCLTTHQHTPEHKQTHAGLPLDPGPGRHRHRGRPGDVRVSGVEGVLRRVASRKNWMHA
jgi:hypothetical protein